MKRETTSTSVQRIERGRASRLTKGPIGVFEEPGSRQPLAGISD